MLATILTVLALAEPPPGFAEVKDAGGCHITMRPEAHPEGAAMRADCHWPEVQAERLVSMLKKVDQYSDYVWPIDLARLERTDGNRMLVYQRQRIFGISDREVLLWMTIQPHNKGTRIAWTAAHDEPLALADGAIRTPRNTGYWHMEPHKDGGVLVIHEIAMHAGGSIPSWLIAMVRTRGFVRVMTDVRALAAAP